MSKKFSLEKIVASGPAEEPMEAPKKAANEALGDHDSKKASGDFQELKTLMQGSKADVVLVVVRMTKSERRKLRAASTQAEIAMQDIVRESLQLWYEKHGMR